VLHPTQTELLKLQSQHQMSFFKTFRGKVQRNKNSKMCKTGL